MSGAARPLGPAAPTFAMRADASIVSVKSSPLARQPDLMKKSIPMGLLFSLRRGVAAWKFTVAAEKIAILIIESRRNGGKVVQNVEIYL